MDELEERLTDNCTPERFYSRFVLVERDSKAVDFIPAFHRHERVRMDIAVEVHVRFDAPVVAVLLQQLMLEEELRALCLAGSAKRVGANGSPRS